ncbi:hypothetical protein THAOC_17847, partial [Thalassiosira oceanica]
MHCLPRAFIDTKLWTRDVYHEGDPQGGKLSSSG